MGIIVKNTLVEAHYFIDIMKRYYRLLQQVYFIIITKIPGIELDLALQMFIKVINNSINSNRLVSTLLVFCAYLK